MLKGAKLSTNATTAIVIVAGLVYLGFTFNRDPASAAAQLIPVLGAMAGAIKLLRQGDAVEAKADTQGAQLAVIAPQVEEAAHQATAAVVAVAENTATTGLTHDLVNSQTDAYKKLMQEQADMKVAMAQMQARLDSTLARAEGMAEGRNQVIAEAAPAAIAAVAGADGIVEVTAPALIEVKAPK